MTDQELILKWLEWLEYSRGRMPSTVNKYLRYIEQLSASITRKDRPGLLAATRNDLEQFTGIDAHRSGMRPRSRRPLISGVRGFYQWAFKRELISENPALSLAYPRTGRTLPKGMDLSNAEKLLMAPGLDTFLGVRDTAILAVFMGCGLRLSGVARLNQSDLIWAKDPKTDNERLVLRVREKGGHQRFLPAPDETRLLIHAYLGHPELQSIDRHLPDGDQVLFVSTNCQTVPAHEYYGEARRLAHRSIDDMMKKHGAKAGIPKNQCHPHALRHLYGTELAEEDTQLLKMQVLMGHSDPKTTKEYAHVAMRSLATVVDKANPLSKMTTPVTELSRVLSRDR